jgi:hypothetical protein
MAVSLLGRICDPLMRQWSFFPIETDMFHFFWTLCVLLYTFCITCSKVRIFRANVCLLFDLAIFYFIYGANHLTMWLLKFVFFFARL